MSKNLQALTHDGDFHLDDVFAGAVLKLLGYSISRSRDSSLFDHYDIVFDVGMGKYDHHYKHATVRDSGIIYSSVGLVWRDFGKKLINQYTDNASHTETVWKSIDNDIELIDGHDNGQNTTLKDQHLSIVSVVHTLSKGGDYDNVMNFIATYLEERIKKELKSLIDYYVIKDMVQIRNDRYWVEITDKTDWYKAVIEDPNLLFVVFATPSQWRIYTVPNGGFSSRMLLTTEKVDGVLFIHPSGFTAGVDTKENAIKLIELSIQREYGY
jgi:uncharacterized UPF0160 family protein